MSRTPFTREFGATQGRVRLPEGWSPPADGDHAFVLGCDREGVEIVLAEGDSIQVAQTVDVTGMKLIRMSVRLKPPERAYVETYATEPFELHDGDDLVVRVGGGAPQTVVFHTADFVDILNARAYEVARVLNAQVVGATFNTVGYTVIGRSTLDPVAGGWHLETVDGAAFATLAWRHLTWQLWIGVGGSVYGQVVLPPAGRARTRTFTFAIPTSHLAGNQSVWARLRTTSVGV